jgi:hypothetical protein
MRPLLLATFLVLACGKKPTTSSDAGGATASRDAGPAVVARRGVTPRELGPAVTLAPEAQTAAAALAARAELPTMDATSGVPVGLFTGNLPAAQDPTVLAHLARDGQEPRVRVAAIQTLAQLAIGPKAQALPDLPQLLTGLMSHADPAVAGGAILASMSILRDDAGVHGLLLESCRERSEAPVRAAACRAAGYHTPKLMRDTATQAALYEALADPEPVVQAATLEVLVSQAVGSEATPPGAAEKVTPLLASKVDAVRGLATVWMIRNGGHYRPTPEAVRRAREVGLSALADPSSYVRGRAAMELAQMWQNWDLVDKVLPLLEDPAPVAAPFKFAGVATGHDSAEATWPGTLSGRFGGEVRQLVLHSLVNKAQFAKGRELKLTHPSDFVRSRDQLLAWWKQHREALLAPASP